MNVAFDAARDDLPLAMVAFSVGQQCGVEDERPPEALSLAFRIGAQGNALA